LNFNDRLVVFIVVRIERDEQAQPVDICEIDFDAERSAISAKSARLDGSALQFSVVHELRNAKLS
jgi:hypothetical protein